MTRMAAGFDEAGIPYQVIGGVAVYLHVDARDPLAARLTRDVDSAVRRQDLERIAIALAPYGFKLRHVAGVDMLVDANAPSARSAVQLVMTGEKVRRDYVEPVPDFDREPANFSGIRIAPVEHIVRMKLTSNRLKDKVHIQDLDKVGLITPEIEAQLSPVLKARLDEIRALGEEDI
jgi:hypothetical protein